MPQEKSHEIYNITDTVSRNRIKKIGIYLSGIVFTTGTVLFGLGLINNFEHNTNKHSYATNEPIVNTNSSNHGFDLMTVGLIGMTSGLVSGLVVNELTRNSYQTSETNEITE